MRTFLRVLFAGIAIVAVLALISGCAATNEVRITEYSADNGALKFLTGEMGGCRVIQEGTVTAEIVFVGERCSVEFKP